MMDEASNIFKAMIDFWNRKTEDCPHCGEHVESMEQVGRCVYSRPCGCRQFQGLVPEKWKEKGS